MSVSKSNPRRRHTFFMRRHHKNAIIPHGNNFDGDGNACENMSHKNAIKKGIREKHLLRTNADELRINLLKFHLNNNKNNKITILCGDYSKMKWLSQCLYPVIIHASPAFVRSMSKSMCNCAYIFGIGCHENYSTVYALCAAWKCHEWYSKSIIFIMLLQYSSQIIIVANSTCSVHLYVPRFIYSYIIMYRVNIYRNIELFAYGCTSLRISIHPSMHDTWPNMNNNCIYTYSHIHQCYTF